MIEKPRDQAPQLSTARSSAMNFSKHTTRLVGRANLHESGILNAAGRPYIPTPSSEGPLGSRTLRGGPVSDVLDHEENHHVRTPILDLTRHGNDTSLSWFCVRVAASLLASLQELFAASNLSTCVSKYLFFPLNANKYSLHFNLYSINNQGKIWKRLLSWNPLKFCLLLPFITLCILARKIAIVCMHHWVGMWWKLITL